MSISRRTVLKAAGLLAGSLAWPVGLAATTKPAVRVYKDPT